MKKIFIFFILKNYLKIIVLNLFLMTDISGIQAVGKGYGLGIFTPQTSVRNKPPDPKISIFKAHDSGHK